MKKRKIVSTSQKTIIAIIMDPGIQTSDLKKRVNVV